MPVTTDEELMLQVRRGSREAFEALFERYRAAVWRFFRRRLPDPSRVEELTQDVFVAILQGSSRYQGTGPVRSYLFGIAYNILLADRRTASTRQTLALNGDLASAGDDPDQGLWVRKALTELDPEDREMLMLREYDQLSYQEIADVKGVPLNTVRSRLFRARMALKSALEPSSTSELKVTHDGR